MAAGTISKRTTTKKNPNGIKPRHNRNNNKYIKDLNPQGTWNRGTFLKAAILVVVLGGAILGSLYLYSRQNSKMTMSQILRQNVDVCEQLLAHEIQVIKLKITNTYLV